MILEFPESTLEEQHMTRVKYHLPNKAFSLSKAFCALELEKDRLGIEDYSISQNTLEQIFLSLANGLNGNINKSVTQHPNYHPTVISQSSAHQDILVRDNTKESLVS
jgi:hypothetical protein